MKIRFLNKSALGSLVIEEAETPEEALGKLARLSDLEGVLFDVETATAFLQSQVQHAADARYIIGRTHVGLQKIPIDSILYFQADQKYVTVHHIHGRLLILNTLKNLELEFAEQFLRVHRNALVNRSAVTGIEKDEAGQFWLILRGITDKLRVSRRQVSTLRKQLRQ